MWIKTFIRYTWINMNHITHFTIEESNEPSTYDVVVYLDVGRNGHDPRQHQVVEGQAFITVYQGSVKECERFIRRRQKLEGFYNWLGYLVAGSLGAVLGAVITLLFGNPAP